MSAETDKWARGVLLEAFAAEGSPNPPLPLLQTVQALCRLEGYYGKAGKPEGWAETKNWGAVHAGFPPCTPPDKEFTDKDEAKKRYAVCIKGYDTHLDAARHVLRIIKKSFPKHRGNALESAIAIDDHYHFAATHEDYAQALYNNSKIIAANIGEPHVVAMSSAPEKKPMDNAQIINYSKEVRSEWQKTADRLEAEQATIAANRRPGFTFNVGDFRRDHESFETWYKDNLLAAGGHEPWVVLWIPDSVYDDARRWHLKQKAWWGEIVTIPGQAKPPEPSTAVPVPGTVTQQERENEPPPDPGDVPWHQNLKTIAVVGGAAAAAYFIFGRK